jgi:Rieske Fe-S protein
MTSTPVQSRRSFFKKFFRSWFVLLLFPAFYAILRYFTGNDNPQPLKRRTRLCSTGDLPQNGVKIVPVENTSVALVNVPGGQLEAFSTICTHKNCTVAYATDRNRFVCECHGSEFDLRGKNINGPAPKPLEKYKVSFEGVGVYVEPGG